MNDCLPPRYPIGTTRRFGTTGETYLVGNARRPLSDGDWLIAITLLGTGEVAEYRLTAIHDDAEEVLDQHP